MEIVTKCDIMLLSDQRPSNRVKHYDTSAAHVQSSVERSLHNIGVDATAPMLGKSGKLSPTWGYKHTPEAIAIITSASTGRTHTPEDIAKIRAHLIGKPKSAEVRAKISATLSGEGNYWRGKKRPDHGQKVSKAVAVTDSSGNVATYPSISAVRDALGMKPPTVNRALKSGTPIKRGKFAGWTFKYVAAADGS
jgi:hypothetical protein